MWFEVSHLDSLQSTKTGCTLPTHVPEKYQRHSETLEEQLVAFSGAPVIGPVHIKMQMSFFFQCRRKA